MTTSLLPRLSTNHGFPTFEPLFELDVEDDFCNSKRQRIDSQYSPETSFCFTDASFSDEDLTFSPCQSEFSFTSASAIDMTPIRASKRSAKAPQSYSAAAHSSSSQPQQVPSNAPASSSSSASGDDHSHSHASSSSTTRRGRKQSLTEDPSKTFVCTLCSRRFRGSGVLRPKSETPDATELGAMLFDHAAAVAGSSSSSQSGYDSAEEAGFQQKKRKRDE